MRLHEAIGQLICPTLFHGASGQAGYDAARTHAELEAYQWGGYILFLDEREAARARIAALLAHAKTPLLIAADMEHGAGQQLAGLSVFPPLMAFGSTGNPDHAYALGAWTAYEALGVGVNWIFGPVADVTNNPLNPIINIRSFGGDPARVAEMVAAFVRGCQDYGALACAKHFPGHGDTETDSHTRLGTVSADLARLESVELPPFRAAVDAGVASVMTAHLAVPALDAPDVPATLSRAVLSGLLRERFGFGGLIVTDALVMGGITGTRDPLEAAIEAIAAGCDMLLMPPDPIATHQALARAVESGRLSEERVREAASRVLAAKARIHPSGTAPSGSPEALAATVAREALTMPKGQSTQALPARALAVAVDDGAELDRLAVWDRALAGRGITARRVVSRATTDAEWDALLAEAALVPHVVLGVFSPIRIHKDRSLLPEALLAPLRRLAASRRTTVVSFSSPFLVAQFPEAAAWLLTYGSRPVQIEAAVTALCEGSAFGGCLPVVLPKQLGGATTGHDGPETRTQSFA